MFKNYDFTVLDRFLRYVQIDTQSDPNSQNSPSTEKQKNLSSLLVQELIAMGVNDAEMTPEGYVYATIEPTSTKATPTLCFCAHVDTAPDFSGTNVKPLVHKNYQGKPLILPDDPQQILSLEKHPELKNKIGEDIVTASGTTLLGADDKAGVAEIMDAAHFLMQHPEVKHGKIRILFTTDEEIGRGVDHIDLKKLGADFAYTIDGETLGHLENETFSANRAIIKIYGHPTHPGSAKGVMESAIKIASKIIASLPANQSPESTEKKEGFIHPVSIRGNIDHVEVQCILRSFQTSELKEQEKTLDEMVRSVFKFYPKSRYEMKIVEEYRNLKEVLDEHPQTVEYAQEAIQRAGLKPTLSSIRGGTDGSHLSHLGLPCPNLFDGGHAFHSPQEWVSVQDMQKAVETIVHLAQVWEEKS